MKRFVSMIALLLVVGFVAADSASAAGWRRSRNCCDCPSGCAAEPACAAAEPACGAAEPACGAQAACCSQPRRRGLRSRRSHHCADSCTSCCSEPACSAEPCCKAQ